MKNFILKVAIIIAVFFGINAKTYSLNKEKIGPIAGKTIVKYTVCDVLGAVQGASWCSIGGPMGTALGIVVGGTVSSGYMFWLNHGKTIATNPIIITNTTTTFLNDFEKVGYLHNKFLTDFINNNQVDFVDEEAFINAIYLPLLNLISTEYEISLDELKIKFTKELLINHVKSTTNTNTNEISYCSQLISDNYNNNNLSNQFEIIMNQLEVESNKSKENGLTYINNFINNIDSISNLTDNEKSILKYSCEIAKFSFSLWSINL
jgi:hypothetical protein